MMINNMPAYILAVDDESDLLLLFQRRMASQGFTVATSLNASEFWEIVGRRRPDVIFLDIQMNGISGGDICRKLKADAVTRAIPVIMMSACMDTEQRAQTFGADGFISKPSTVEVVVSEIQRVLQHTSGESNSYGGHG